LAEYQKLGLEKSQATLLDIGCGHGFDLDQKLQRQLADGVEKYIGVEPDTQIQVNSFISPVHRCFFEDAPIDANSVDIAFAVMVLEHLPEPERFWDHVHRTLKPGGVFWGFTVNGRHPFTLISAATGKLGIKDRYLDWVKGAGPENRHENYPTFYRANTEDALRVQTKAFSSMDLLCFKRARELAWYLPKGLKGLAGVYDSITRITGLPQSGVIAVRVQK
jgi:SAM-dependent methyltransferase